MARYIFVFSPMFPRLYAHLAHDFPDDPVVEVILNRRVAERRIARMQPPDGDRRRRERRANPYSDHDLVTLGYVLVRVDPTSRLDRGPR